MGAADGVLLIETCLHAQAQESNRPDGLQPSGTYHWSLELEPHNGTKVFLSSALGNAIGVGLGVAIASRCIDFSDRSKGRFWYQMAVAGFALLLGYALAVTSADSNRMSWAAYTIVGIGVPLAVTTSDRLCRKIFQR